LDLQFIDARHKLIDIAAFLDRIDRHPGEDDYRFEALKNALPILLANRPDRARAILESFSDHTTQLSPFALFQSAYGAALPEPPALPFMKKELESKIDD
ncbi:MAG: hypothetical protein ABI162_15865, partial [Luteolibacter sp.]